jgi:hypothetical protein
LSFITSYCRIKKNVVLVNGEQIFSSPNPLPEFAEAVYKFLGVDYPKFYKMDNLSKLGFLACEFLLKGIVVKEPYRATVILSNSSSSLDADFRYQDASQKLPSPALFVYTLPNIVAGELFIRHGIKGESNFFVSPEYDPDFLSSYINTLFQQTTDLCIAGWAEVLGDEADIFLYLIQTKQEGLSLEHTAQNLKNLYHS